MNRISKLAIALFALALLALAPSYAAANWTHKGKGELKENASVTLSGTLTLTTSAGNVSCATEIGATLTASSSAGHVNSFSVAEPSECDLTGTLAALCGTNGLTKVEKTGTWALTADEEDVTVSEIDVHYGLAGCLVPGFRLKGSATASLDKSSAIGSATFSGTQTLFNALGEESGSGSLGDTLAVSPAGTYGVKPVPTVPTKWKMSNSPLGSNGEMTLAGTLAFSYGGGGVSCPVSAKAVLTAGEVEEGDPEGEIESLTVAKPSECDVTGTLKELCGTNSVAAVEKTGTWALTTDESDIAIAGLELDYEFKECAVSSLAVKGDATLAVTSPTSIVSTSVSGSPIVYNAAEVEIGTATLSGSQSASPSGTYAIKGSPPTGEVALENESNEPVEVGSLVTAVSTDTLMSATSGASFNCEVEGITGEVTENSPHVTIEEIEYTASDPCVYSGPLPAHFEGEIESITLEAGEEGTLSGLAFQATITTGGPHGTCLFEGVEYDPETEETIEGGMELGWNETSIFFQPTGHDNLLGTAPCGPTTITGSFEIGDHDHTEEWHLVEGE